MTELVKERILESIEDKYISEAIAYMKEDKGKKQRVIATLGRMAAVLALIVGLSISSLMIAVAAGSIAAYDVLYALYPEIATKLMPVKVSCEDQGICMEVEGVSIQDSQAYIYISMQDREGERIDGSIDLFDSYRIHTNAAQIGGCTLVDFEEADRKATFLIIIQNMDGSAIEGSVMTFSVSKFLAGKGEMEEELTQISLQALSEVTETQAGENLNIRGASYAYGKGAEKKEKEYLCVDESKMFVPTPGVTVTNYGFINNELHVQVYYEDILHFDNHGSIYLSHAEGGELFPESSTAFWDEEKKGSFEEYIFNIGAEEVKEYAIYGYFVTCQTLVEGDWEVMITIKNR